MYISISLRRLFDVTKMSQRGPSTFCACNVTNYVACDESHTLFKMSWLPFSHLIQSRLHGSFVFVTVSSSQQSVVYFGPTDLAPNLYAFQFRLSYEAGPKKKWAIMRWHGFRYSEWRDDWRPTALCFALLAIHRIPIKRVTHCTVVTQLTRHPPFCYFFFETAKYTGARSGNSLMLRMYVYDGGKGWKKSKIQSKILDSSPIQIFLPDPVKNPVSRKDFKSKSNPQSNPNVPLN